VLPSWVISTQFCECPGQPCPMSLMDVQQSVTIHTPKRHGVRQKGFPARAKAEVMTRATAADLVVRPCVDHGVVGRQRRGGWEGPAPGGVEVLDLWVAAVAQHQSAGWGGHREEVRGLEVGLVEAGPDVPCVVGREVRVGVHLAVGRINRLVRLTSASLSNRGSPEASRPARPRPRRPPNRHHTNKC
jgi:hypothetical protein